MARLYAVLAEFGAWLGVALVYYFVFTRQRRRRLITVLGILGAAASLAGYPYSFHFPYTPLAYQSWNSQAYIGDYPNYAFSPRCLVVLLNALCALALAAVLYGLILCAVQLIRRRELSKKQILILTLPLLLFVAAALTSGLYFFAVSREALLLLVGLPELILALTCLLTLWGKQGQACLSSDERAPHIL